MDDMVINVDIPPDEDGFLDRQCHSENCGRYFKILHRDWEVAETNAVTCPFCGYVDEPTNFTTQEQQQYLNHLAVAIAQQKLQEMLSGFAKSINKRQSKKSLFSIDVRTKFSEISVPVTPEAVDSMRLQIKCDQCHCTYAVVGAGFFCPLCGTNSARHTFQQAIAKARNAVEVARELGTRESDRDAAAEARRDALENQINNLVTAFQRFGESAYGELPGYSNPPKRNVFQRLADASQQWAAAGGRTFESMLEPNEWGELLTYFQQRHVLSHQDGFVDAEYITNSRDTSYQPGQRLVMSEAQVLRMAELVEKLGVAMQADLPEGNAPRASVTASTTRPAFPSKLPGVTDDDWKVYRLICEAAVADEDDMVGGEAVWRMAQDEGMSEEQFRDSLEILEGKSVVRRHRHLGERHIPTGISLTRKGWEIYFASTMTTYQANRKRVASQIVEGATASQTLIDNTGLPKSFVHYALRDFESRGWVGEIFWNGGVGIIPTFNASLKRFAQG
jgi:hypothetical protein